MSDTGGSPLLRGTGVGRTWGDRTGLAPLDFVIRSGRLTGLRGRSGSGKSTLLAILAGWLDPTTGTVDRDSTTDPAQWRGTAIVPQALGLMPELTLMENVELPLRLLHGRGSDDTATVTGLLERLDLGALTRRLPAELSLGQQQRAAIARAAVARPGLLLVDEPTSHQDADHAAAVLHVLRDALTASSATLLASHDEIAIDATDDVIDLDRSSAPEAAER